MYLSQKLRDDSVCEDCGQQCQCTGSRDTELLHLRERFRKNHDLEHETQAQMGTSLAGKASKMGEYVCTLFTFGKIEENDRHRPSVAHTESTESVNSTTQSEERSDENRSSSNIGNDGAKAEELMSLHSRAPSRLALKLPTTYVIHAITDIKSKENVRFTLQVEDSPAKMSLTVEEVLETVDSLKKEPNGLRLKLHLVWNDVILRGESNDILQLLKNVIKHPINPNGSLRKCIEGRQFSRTGTCNGFSSFV